MSIQVILISCVLSIFIRSIHNIYLFERTRNGAYLIDPVLPHRPYLDSPIAFAVVLILGCLIPSIIEEICFRGVIQTGLSRYGKICLGLVLTTIIYTLGYHPLVIGPLPLLLGLATSRLRYIFDDCRPAILANLVIRISGYLFDWIIPRFDSPTILSSVKRHQMIYQICLVLIFFSAIFLWILWDHLEKHAPFGYRKKRFRQATHLVRQIHPWKQQVVRISLKRWVRSSWIILLSIALGLSLWVIS